MTTQGSQVGEIPKEHLIALLLGVAAIATGVALLFAASLFPAASVGSFYVGSAIAIGSVCAAAFVAIYNAGSKMLPIIGMILFGFGFLGCFAWHYFTPGKADGGDGPVPGGGGVGLTGGDGGSVRLGVATVEGGKGAPAAQPAGTSVTSNHQTGGQTAATINNYSTMPADEREAQRRLNVLREILADFERSHDGIQPLLADELKQADTFINEGLARRGESWRLTDQTKRELKLPQ